MKLKLTLLLLTLTVFMATSALAQGEQPPIPAPPPEGKYVLDELGWLLGKDEARINTIVRQLDQDGLAEIAVVTLNDCGSNKTAFRKELFDTWGIGHADDNDGLLILVCWYDGDPNQRSVEQVYGPGLNRILSTAKTDQIAQDNFVPAFHMNKPGDGLLAMIKSYDELLRMANNPSGRLAGFWEILPSWLQIAFLSLLMIGGIFVIDKFFPGWLRSDRDRWPTDRENWGSDRDRFGGGSSGGGSDGGGSSTRF